MGRDWKRRIGCIILALTLTVSNVQPAFATAAEDDTTGLCDHHLVHENCGYVEGDENSCAYDCILCAEQRAAEEKTAAEQRAAEEKAAAEQRAAEEKAAAEQKAAAEKAMADQAAADAVRVQISALPTVAAAKEMTKEAQLAAHEQTQAAYTAYNALTEEQKALLPTAEEVFKPLFDYFNSLTAEAMDVTDSFAIAGSCGDLGWELENGTLTISGTGAMPDFLENSAPWSSYCSDITTVILTDGVTSVGGYAFHWCTSLQSVTIPKGVTSIGEGAFKTCTSLSSITIPESVTTIGEAAFSRCFNLSSITIPEGLTAIGDHVFSGCNNLSSIRIPESVTTIGNNAFYDCCSLSSITIPEGVTAIGDVTFRLCSNLEEIKFTGNAPTFGSDAFSELTVTAYYPSGDATWTEEVRQNYGGTITWVAYDPENGETGDTENTLHGGTCGDLNWELEKGTLTISGTGTMLDYSGADKTPWWKYRININKIVVEEGVTGIGNWSFGHSSVTEVSLPASLNSIGDYAFGTCTSLISVQIPDGITSIGFLAFNGCTGLATVYFEGDAPKLEGMIFSDVVIATAYYPQNNATWTESYRKDAGPNITWIAYNPDGNQSTYVLYPENGATDVGTVSALGKEVGIDKLTITFDKKIKKNSANDSRALLNFSAGNIAIYRKADDTLVWKVTEDPYNPGTAGGVVSVDSAQTTLIIEPTNRHILFDFESEYYVVVDAGFINFEDGSTNDAVAKGNWGFTTILEQQSEESCTLSELTDIDYLAFSAIAYLPFEHPENETDKVSIQTYLMKIGKWDALWDNEQNIKYSELCAHIAQWKVSRVRDLSGTNGFYAVAFESTYGDIVIAYRGSTPPQEWGKSDGDAFYDWLINDLPIELANRMGPQLSSALKMYNTVARETDKSKIVVTGHSLGGAWADVVSVYSGCKGVTYNAVSILDVAYKSIPDSLGVEFLGVDKWNFVDHTNEYDALAGMFEAKMSVRIKPYISHKSSYMVDEAALAALCIAVPIGALAGPVGVVAASLGVTVPALLDICACHGLSSMITRTNDGDLAISDIADSFSPSKVISNYMAMSHESVDLGTSKEDVIHFPGSILVDRTSFGGAGDDRIFGNIWSDVIVGGMGTDELNGSWGDDTYYYYKGDRIDYIYDVDGKDELRIVGYDESEEIFAVQNGKFVEIQIDGRTIVRIRRDRNGKSDTFVVMKWGENSKTGKEITSLLHPRKVVNRTYIACPVSVEVIDDATGNVVHTMVNDASGVGAAYTDYGFFYVYQDESGEYVKVADLFEGYSLRIVGEDEGTMDVSVYEVTEDGLAEPVSLADVPVTDKLSATIEKKNDGKLYLIVDSDSDDETDQEIPFDGDTADDDGNDDDTSGNETPGGNTPGGDSSGDNTPDSEQINIDGVISPLQGLTTQNVTPGDKAKIQTVIDAIDDLLERDDLTDTQRQQLTAAKETARTLLNAIAALETSAKNVSDMINSLESTVEPDDEDAVEKIMAAKKAHDELDARAKALISTEQKTKLDALIEATTDYKIIKGNNGNWWENSVKTLSFTVNAPFSKFESVEVDGKTIAESNYTAKSGSTVITLKNSYLRTLSVGEHTITVVFTDNEARGNFTVQEETVTPSTGDTFHLTLWVSVMVVAGASLAALLYKKRKQK